MDPRISYVLDTFRQLYCVPDEIPIIYGDLEPDVQKTIRIRSNVGRFFEGSDPVNPDHLVFKKWLGTPIPLLFEDSAEPDWIEMNPSGALIPYDIIAASFYFLSGWQEYVTNRQEYESGRYPYHKSLQYQLETADIPWVNYYFDVLKTAIERVYEVELSPRKGDTDFHLAVTHDIDTLFSGWIEEAYAALKSGELAGMYRILLNRMKGQDPWFNLPTVFDRVIELASGTSFFFLTNTATVDGKKQADYNIDDPRVSQQIQMLRSRGAEIAIHGSIGSHRNVEMLRHEISQLGTGIRGGRFHYLYYDADRTPEVLQEVGLQYDSTLGFAEQVGFRNAYAHPFYLYDLKNNRRTDVLEIPLLIMDATLQHRRYMHLEPKDSFAETVPILQEMEKFNGAASILWHNSYFSDFKYAGWEGVFIELLNYCTERNGSTVSASNIVPYYTFNRSD